MSWENSREAKKRLQKDAELLRRYENAMREREYYNEDLWQIDQEKKVFFPTDEGWRTYNDRVKQDEDKIKQLDEKCKRLDETASKALNERHEERRRAMVFYDKSQLEAEKVRLGLRLITEGYPCEAIGSMLCGKESCDCSERFAMAWMELITQDPPTIVPPAGIDQESWTAAAQALNDWEEQRAQAEVTYGPDDPWDRGIEGGDDIPPWNIRPETPF